MTIHAPDPDLYRPNVGLALFSKAGYVFIGRRINGRGAFQWQMPQGGIDKGETPLVGALRELEEEVGVPEKLVDVLEETSDWLFYDFPPDLKKEVPSLVVPFKRMVYSEVSQRFTSWAEPVPGHKEVQG